MAEPIRFKTWPKAKDQHYERSFDRGKTWATCSLRDILNAFSALRAIRAQLDKGRLLISGNKVWYRRRTKNRPAPARETS